MANNSIGAYAQGGSNDIGAYEKAAAGGDTTVNVGVKALTLATLAATVTVTTDVDVGVASLTLTTYNPTVSVEFVDTDVNVGVVSLTLTTYRADITPKAAGRSFLRDITSDIVIELVTDLVQ